MREERVNYMALNMINLLKTFLLFAFCTSRSSLTRLRSQRGGKKRLNFPPISRSRAALNWITTFFFVSTMMIGGLGKVQSALTVLAVKISLKRSSAGIGFDDHHRTEAAGLNAGRSGKHEKNARTALRPLDWARNYDLLIERLASQWTGSSLRSGKNLKG